MKNELFEPPNNISIEYAVMIKDYFYNHRKTTSLLGVSSYGTVFQLAEKQAMEVVLASPTATVDTAGIIGSIILPDEGRLLILYSTVKMMMFVWLVTIHGYGKGVFAMDATYKIFKEGLSMITCNVADVACIGKLNAFGPTSHEDTRAYHDASNMVYDFVTVLVDGIRNCTLPEMWSHALRTQVYDAYSVAVLNAPAEKLALRMGASISDCDDAIRNGMMTSKLQPEMHKNDYPHITRGVHKNLNKLKNSSDDAVEELFTDLAFLHECYDIDLLEHQKIMFRAKLYAKGEGIFLAYLEKEYLSRNFSRCHGVAGDRTDDCSLEQTHRWMKSEEGFANVGGAHTVMDHAPTYCYRVSISIILKRM